MQQSLALHARAPFQQSGTPDCLHTCHDATTAKAHANVHAGDGAVMAAFGSHLMGDFIAEVVAHDYVPLAPKFLI